MQPCSSGCIHVYIGIMTSEYFCNISEHVVWWLGNETVALLQSHPNEALALLQRHPKQNGTLTAPVLMTLLQRQPSLLALLQCQGFPWLLQLVQGKVA